MQSSCLLHVSYKHNSIRATGTKTSLTKNVYLLELFFVQKRMAEGMPRAGAEEHEGLSDRAGKARLPMSFCALCVAPPPSARFASRVPLPPVASWVQRPKCAKRISVTWCRRDRVGFCRTNAASGWLTLKCLLRYKSERRTLSFSTAPGFERLRALPGLWAWERSVAQLPLQRTRSLNASADPGQRKMADA